MLLGRSTAGSGALSSGSLLNAEVVVPLPELVRRSALGPQIDSLRGRCAVLLLCDQMAAALAMLELDGVVRRMVLCTPDLAVEHLPQIVRDADADSLVVDAGTGDGIRHGTLVSAEIDLNLPYEIQARQHWHDTEWVLLTSGTTGAPKLVLHTLASLSSAFADSPRDGGSVVWSTFYDIRRYGGLQIFLRAQRSGSMVLSSPKETVDEFLARAGASGVTHMSGTASHWRRALMSGSTASIAPRYIRLSGEIADQSVLDGLHAAFPNATIAHAFASTEAGVAFEVTDGIAGFPVGLVSDNGQRVELKIMDGTLRIRSPGNAQRYLGDSASPLRQRDGFVDTGDQLELRDGRYFFSGRSGGVINVGGLKVYPEEVESVINALPWVRMSRVQSRRNAVTGAVVTAEVVLTEEARSEMVAHGPEPEHLRRGIIEHCARALPSYKVPAIVRIVESLEVSAAGKLVRRDA